MSLCDRKGCWRELSSLNRLAFYSIITNIFESSFNLVDMIMLGHLGKGNLAAGVIALCLYNIAWYFLEGFLSAQDTLSSRAAALHDITTARYWSYISLIFTVLLALLFTPLFLFSPLIIPNTFNVQNHFASKAIVHVFLLLPAFWFQSLFRVLQKYLQSQYILVPVLGCSLLGVCINILGNYLFMFPFHLGFYGVGVSTSISRGVMLIVLTNVVLSREDKETIYSEMYQIWCDLRTHSFTSQGHAANVTSNNTSNNTINDTASVAADDNQLESGLELTTQSLSSVQNNPMWHNITHYDKQSHHKQQNSAQSFNTHNDNNIDNDTNLNEDINDNTLNFNDKQNNHNENENDEDEAEESLLHTDNNTNSITNSSADNNNREPVHHNSIYVNMYRFAVLGLPGALTLCLDVYPFEVVCTLFVAQMGAIALDSYQIVVMVTNFFYLSLPFAISIASTIRINKHLALHNHAAARRAAWLSIFEGTVLMCLSAGLVYVSASYMGYIFSSDSDVTSRVEGVALWAAVFQITFSIHAMCQGVLRSTSHQMDVTLWSLVLMWVIGTPVAIYLAFYNYPRLGLAGIWIGLSVGMCLLSIVLLFYVYTIDWEKESRRVVFMLNRDNGIDTDSTQETTQIIPSNVRNNTAFNRGIVTLDAVTPVIGSRSMGGFSLNYLFYNTQVTENVSDFEINEMQFEPTAQEMQEILDEEKEEEEVELIERMQRSDRRQSTRSDRGSGRGRGYTSRRGSEQSSEEEEMEDAIRL